MNLEQRPFVYIPDANLPTMEDETIMARAFNRGRYDSLQAMKLGDVRDAILIIEQLENFTHENYLSGTTDETWFMLSDSVY
jgi:hypothetical protein